MIFNKIFQNLELSTKKLGGTIALPSNIELHVAYNPSDINYSARLYENNGEVLKAISDVCAASTEVEAVLLCHSVLHSLIKETEPNKHLDSVNNGIRVKICFTESEDNLISVNRDEMLREFNLKIDLIEERLNVTRKPFTVDE